jgi:MYXO-CTERM domain-containing protein
LSDGAEINLYKTDPKKRDTDGGGLEDGKEVTYGLNPINAADDDSLMNTTGGLVLVGGQTDGPSAVFYKQKTTISSSIDAATVTERSLDRYLGRIYDTLVLTSSAGGQTLSLNSKFGLGVIDPNSQTEIHELQIGRKNIPDPSTPKYEFDGVGTIELTTSPYTIFEFMIQVGAWTRSEESGETESLELDNPEFTATSTTFDVDFEIKLPSTAGRLVHIAYDIRGVERYAEENTCDDGTDNDNDKAIDCEDPDCDGHPNCAAPPPEMMTPMPPPEEDKDGGCDCRTTNTARNHGGALVWFLGLLWMRRRGRPS